MYKRHTEANRDKTIVQKNRDKQRQTGDETIIRKSKQRQTETNRDKTIAGKIKKTNRDKQRQNDRRTEKKDN